MQGIASRVRVAFAAVAMVLLAGPAVSAHSTSPQASPWDEVLRVGPAISDFAVAGPTIERFDRADRRTESSIDRLLGLATAAAAVLLAWSSRSVRWFSIVAAATRPRMVGVRRRGPPNTALT